MAKNFKIGRNALTGRLVPVAVAKRTPSKYVVESMPTKGNGDTKKK